MYAHPIRVRYGECDPRGYAHHGAYLAYVDDAAEQWFKARLGADYLARFDFMVKRAELRIDTPARHDDTFEIVPVVSRWGTTSFDVTCRAEDGPRLVYEVRIVYVSVTPGSGTPCPVPDHVRAALSST